jgi:Uncharacterized protein conserved in bacteria
MRVWPVAFGFVALVGATAPSPAAEKTVSDLISGYRICDPDPEARRTFRWTGPCRNGFAHGDGVLEWTVNGQPYGWAEGTFVDGRLEGETRVEWEDGRTFTGTYHRGRASGHGTLTFPNGHRYVGSFERDRPTGEGEFISSMGIRYSARVEGNGEVRPGAMLDPNEPGSVRSAHEPPLPAKSIVRPKVPSVTRSLERPLLSKRGADSDLRTPDIVPSAEKPSPLGEAVPGSLEEWLRQPPPVFQHEADFRTMTDDGG